MKIRESLNLSFVIFIVPIAPIGVVMERLLIDYRDRTAIRFPIAVKLLYECIV